MPTHTTNVNYYLLLLFSFLFTYSWVWGQQGTPTANPSAALEIFSSDKGILITRIYLTSATNFAPISGTPSSDHEGLLVYNINTTRSSGLQGAGFYYWSGGASGRWIPIHQSITTTNTDSQTLDLTGNTLSILGGNSIILPTGSNTNTDSQTLTLTGNILGISSGNSVTLNVANTDSQTLAFGAAATTSATTLEISRGNALTLQASGSLAFTQTGTNTLQLAVTNVDTTRIIDSDGDTYVNVEENPDEDIVRFGTGNTDHKILQIEYPGTNFGPAGGGRAVIGLEPNAMGQYDSRLRITAGENDPNDGSQGGSIDFHGNHNLFMGGRLDLVAGASAIGTLNAITFWTNTDANNQSQKMGITGNGNVGIGTISPTETLHVNGNIRLTGTFQDSRNTSGTYRQILSATGTGTLWKDPPNSGTYSQTLAFGPSATSTETLLEITEGNALTLQASGSIAFAQTGTDTLQLIVASTDATTLLRDADGDTQIQVEETADDDTLRFETDGQEWMTLDASGSLSLFQLIEGVEQVILGNNSLETFDANRITLYNLTSHWGEPSTLFNQQEETGGGSAIAVERYVNILRKHYTEVNFIVPDYAYSAGTIFCMSGDYIYMDYFSVLGPIDPQIQNKEGKFVAALGYLDKINELIEKAKNNDLTQAEFLILKDFDLAELRGYEQAKELTI